MTNDANLELHEHAIRDLRDLVEQLTFEISVLNERINLLEAERRGFSEASER
jgi:hypothetical protein